MEEILVKDKLLFNLVLCTCLFLITGCGLSKTVDEEEKPKVIEEEDAPEEKVEAEKKEAAEEIEADEEVEQESSKEASEEKEKDAESVVKLGDYHVFLGGEMVETEDKLIINGESNLLPGARVVGEVIAGDEEYMADTTEIVQDDGTFHMEIPYQSIGKEAHVTIKFHFDGQQDKGIVRHYGDRGQKLEGPYIYQHRKEFGGRSPKSIYRKAEARVSFEPSEELAVRHFKEPVWYEIPEDMGDPRVWIEVEEINNDDEHFYIHGRSNLIEGSRLRIEHKVFNDDETLVNPDGSFDFKLDYEYLEDTPFKIKFDPNSLQWNIVEETYGKEGQKLVGNLVETNSYNQYQTILKTVELESSEIDLPDNVELNIDGSEVTMLVPDDVLFDFDKHQLKDSSKEVLSEISKALSTSFNKKDLEILINGHTDNEGNPTYNLELSEKRAGEVKKFMAEQLTDAAITFETKGYGETKPIASNDNEKGRQKNRRVEIVINLR